MSLSGYEELANDDDTTTTTTTTADESTALRDDLTADHSVAQEQGVDTSTTRNADQSSAFQGEESLLDDAELSGSTPRPPATKTIKADFANLESPYETMKREMKKEEEGYTTVLDEDDNDDEEDDGEEGEDSTVLFAQRTARLPDMSMTPMHARQMSARRQSPQKHKDPLLHRVLDKTYRLQSTPHRPQYRVSPLKRDTGATEKDGRGVPSWPEDSPASSPEMAIPTLRSEAFMSPYKSNARQRLAAATNTTTGRQPGPRTPGVSVQTPNTAKKSRDAFADAAGTAAYAGNSSRATGKQPKYEIDWESDEDDNDADLYAGMSPPKTIQFALPPSKLLQTPGRFRQAQRHLPSAQFPPFLDLPRGFPGEIP